MILFNDIVFNLIMILSVVALISLIIVTLLVADYLYRDRQQEKEKKLITTYIERKNAENARIKL